MWRQAFARAPSRFRIAPSRSISNLVRSGEKVTHFNVRIKPRQSVARKVAISGLVGVACYIVWLNVAFYPLRNLDLSGDMEALDEGEPLFLPFPFTDKQVKPLPYAGSDEEWQNFIKFNSDMNLRDRVKHELALMVKRSAESNPLTKTWAKNGQHFQLGPAWLILSFPEVPPPEFVRTGLELFGEKGIEIKEKAVDHRTKVLVDRVLMPWPVALASYAYFKTMIHQNVSHVAQFFGFSTQGRHINTSSPDRELEETIKKLQARQTAGGDTATNTPSNNNDATPPAASEAGRETPAPKDATNAKKLDNPNNTHQRPIPKENIPYHATLAHTSSSGSGPWAAFKQTYTSMWKPPRYYPPRGSLAIHGIVRLDSPKGEVFIDVFAWYHPKTQEFHEGSLSMRLRGISPAHQRPRR